MGEDSIDKAKAAGLCKHGNFSGCDQCKQAEDTANQETGDRPVEFKDGFPIISRAEFFRMKLTDIRTPRSTAAATFDFQGFVEETTDVAYVTYYGKEPLFKDTMSTNGILRTESQPGISVETDGGINFNDKLMKSPADLAEYDIYIKVPASLQEEKGVVVYEDSCKLLSDFNGDEKALAEARNNDGNYIIMVLDIRPEEDIMAREKVQLMHARIVKFIENGGDLSQIKYRARELEDKLKELSPEDFAENKETLEI